MPSGALLHRVAASTEGFAGADLQALCTAAVMAAISRAAPTLVDQLCDTSEDQEQRHPNQQQQQYLSSQQQQQQDVVHHPQLQHDQLHQQVQYEQPGEEQQPAEAQQLQPWQHSNGQHLPNQVHEQRNMQEQPELHPQHGATHKKGQQRLPGGLSRSMPWKLLEKLKVKAVDWQAALAAAPLPCSARQNMSALSCMHARGLPHHMAPLLLPCLTTALRCIASAQLPWQGPTASALEAVGEADDACERQEQAQVQYHGRQKRRLEAVLTELGAIEAPPLHQSGMPLYHAVSLFYLQPVSAAALLQRPVQCLNTCSIVYMIYMYIVHICTMYHLF